jgi:hypothetical protein
MRMQRSRSLISSSRKRLLGNFPLLLLAMSALAPMSLAEMVEENRNSARDGDSFACEVSFPSSNGMLAATEFLNAAGGYSARYVRWSGMAKTVEPDDKASALSISWSDREGALPKTEFDNGLLSMTFQPDISLAGPAFLMLSRGPYLNFDLAHAKLFYPEYHSDNGSLEAVDAIIGFRSFVEDQTYFGWTLKDINSRKIVASGSVDLLFLKPLRSDFETLDQRFSQLRKDFKTRCRRVRVVTPAN